MSQPGSSALRPATDLDLEVFALVRRWLNGPLGDPALQTQAQRVEALRRLLARGATVECLHPPWTGPANVSKGYAWVHHTFCTPLTAAIAQSNMQWIDAFAELGLPLTTNAGGWTPARAALSFGREEALHRLRELGAVDVLNDRDTEHDTLLHSAAGVLHQFRVRDMLAWGSDPNAVNAEGRTPLFWCVASARHRAFGSIGAIACMDELVAAGANVHHRAGNGGTLMHHAAASNAPPGVIDHLLKWGLDINARRDHGRTALFDALRWSDTVRYLVRRGADMELQDEHGCTALLEAIGSSGLPYHGYESSAQALMELGANTDIVGDVLVYEDGGEHGRLRLSVREAIARTGREELEQALLARDSCRTSTFCLAPGAGLEEEFAELFGGLEKLVDQIGAALLAWHRSTGEDAPVLSAPLRALLTKGAKAVRHAFDLIVMPAELGNLRPWADRELAALDALAVGLPSEDRFTLASKLDELEGVHDSFKSKLREAASPESLQLSDLLRNVHVSWDYAKHPGTRWAYQVHPPSPELLDPVEPAPRPQKPSTTCTVWFATNRARSFETHFLRQTREFYRGSRGDGSVQFGQAMVSVPAVHQGAAAQPSKWRTLQFRHDESQDMLVTDVRVWQAEAWCRAAEASDQDGVLFIPGYNVSFEESMLRAAQLSFDLKLPGPCFCFSWPSAGDPLAYAADETEAEASIPYLRLAIVTIANWVSLERLHIVAHGMGVRVLTGALEDIALDKVTLMTSLGQVVVAAADIEAENFLQPPTALESCEQVTSYASRTDAALSGSRSPDRTARLGDANPPLVLEGIATIDATSAGADLFGYSRSYVADRPSVLGDLSCVLQQGLPPGERPSLRRLPAGYFELM